LSEPIEEQRVDLEQPAPQELTEEELSNIAGGNGGPGLRGGGPPAPPGGYAPEAEKAMSEELRPQELENDQPAAPEELSEQELTEIAGGNGGGTSYHGGPPPPPGG
jgi:bacteriocin-like protein